MADDSLDILEEKLRTKVAIVQESLEFFKGELDFRILFFRPLF